MLDTYIERESTSAGELPADIFFDLLLERVNRRNDEPLALSINISPKGDSVILTPDRELPDITVRGNEILVGEHRLVFQLNKP